MYYSGMVTINWCAVAASSLAFYFRSSSTHGDSIYSLIAGIALNGLGLIIEMKSSTGNNLTKDLIGVFLALLVGLGGQIFILNPINILSPQLPMLTQQDWPRSHVDQELMISENWERPEGREYFIRLQITEKGYDCKAEIEQRTTWYADASQPAIAAASELKWYYTQPDATTPPDTDTPTSWLYCADFPFETTTRSCGIMPIGVIGTQK